MGMRVGVGGFGRDGFGGANRKGSQMLVIVCGHHSPAPFDLRLFHAHRTVEAVELVVQTACVADGVAIVVTPPQRSDGGAAILARDDNTCRRCAALLRTWTVWRIRMR